MTAAVLLLSATLWGGCQRTNTVEDPPQRGAFPAVRTPIAIPPQGLALVTDNGSDEISAIDLAQDLVVAQPFVGVDPIAANGPHELAVDTKGGFVYVLLTFPPPVVPSGPHAAHGLSTVPGIVEKLDLRDLSRAALLTVDVNPGDVQTTPDESKVLVSHFDLNKAITAEAQGLPVDQMRATLMVIDAASMQPIVDVPVCVAPHEIDVSADGTTVYLACYGEDAVGIVHLDSPQLVSNPTAAVERFPIGPGVGPPANPAYGPYSITVTDTQIVLGDSVSKTLDILDLTTRQLVKSIAFPGTVLVPGPGTTPTEWFVPTQTPDELALVDISSGLVKTTRSFADGSCVKPHQVAGLGSRYFLTCEGDRQNPSVVLEIDPATLATVRSFDVGVYPDVIDFVGGP